MRAKDFITEGLNHPIICVDVQPEYAYFKPEITNICDNIIRFVNKQTGPVLMFINAEESGTSGDTKEEIMRYWEYTMTDGDEDWYDAGNPPPVDWDRFTIVDKGYGYLRSWMDHDVSPKSIIKVIRLMYQNKISDSRELFGGEESKDFEISMKALIGYDYVSWMKYDPITVNWASVAQLKQFSGSYIVGGGRNECLREVELLMNSFNIRYKRIDSLVY